MPRFVVLAPYCSRNGLPECRRHGAPARSATGVPFLRRKNPRAPIRAASSDGGRRRMLSSCCSTFVISARLIVQLDRYRRDLSVSRSPAYSDDRGRASRGRTRPFFMVSSDAPEARAHQRPRSQWGRVAELLSRCTRRWVRGIPSELKAVDTTSSCGRPRDNPISKAIGASMIVGGKKFRARSSVRRSARAADPRDVAAESRLTNRFADQGRARRQRIRHQRELHAPSRRAVHRGHDRDVCVQEASAPGEAR